MQRCSARVLVSQWSRAWLHHRCGQAWQDKYGDFLGFGGLKTAPVRAAGHVVIKHHSLAAAFCCCSLLINMGWYFSRKLLRRLAGRCTRLLRLLAFVSIALGHCRRFSPGVLNEDARNGSERPLHKVNSDQGHMSTARCEMIINYMCCNLVRYISLQLNPSRVLSLTGFDELSGARTAKFASGA